MKIRTQEIYNCDHCNKLYLKKQAAVYHEEACKKNPANRRPCFRCIHLSKSDEQAIQTYYEEDQFIDVKVLFCLKKKVCLHTPVNEAKGNVFELVEQLNEPMPKECDLFQGTEPLDSFDELNSEFSFLRP